jgi:hypothetical protein
VLISRRNFTFDGKVRAAQEAEFVVYEYEEKPASTPVSCPPL